MNEEYTIAKYRYQAGPSEDELRLWLGLVFPNGRTHPLGQPLLLPSVSAAGSAVEQRCNLHCPQNQEWGSSSSAGFILLFGFEVAPGSCPLVIYASGRVCWHDSDGNEVNGGDTMTGGWSFSTVLLSGCTVAI
jgi:hypothetical protein